MNASGHLSPSKIMEIRAHARAGLHITAISELAGVSRKAVRKHARDLVQPGRRAEPDFARLRRIAAARAAPGLDREATARRFGLTHWKSFLDTAAYARRMLQRSAIQPRRAA